MLRACRVRAGLTQREVASLAGVSVRTLRDLEHGQVRLPRPDTLRRLAKVVGLGDDVLSAGEAALGGVIGVLGPLRVERAGSPAEVGTGKRRRLLALLALHPNRVVGHADIVEALWRQSPPVSHRKLVSGYIAELRPILGEFGPEVATVAGGYRLSVTAEQLDLLRFEELARRAEADRLTAPRSALERYGQALGCWRGPVLSGEDAALRAYPVAAGLTRRRIAVLLAYADLAIELGEHASAETELRQVIDDEPLHEGLHARLMLALAGAGQQSAALRMYTEIRTRLADELGVDPSQELRAAHERVLGQQVGGTDRNQRTPAQLPADVAGFAGRERHLEQLDALLANPGTVTVIGSAGVGKTALAVHWAHTIRERFPDGQLFADLRGYSLDTPARPVLVLAQFLRALGVPAERVPVDPAEASALYRTLLADRRMLIVLDNAASSDHVRPLLPGSPDCLVVITSRDRLTGLMANPGAHRVELDVLTRDESTALLTNLLGVDRVAASPAATAALARLCAYLPLALRVAAATLVSQPHRDIGERTAELAADRLGMLDAAGDTTAAVRHAFGYSYAGLPDRTRRVFRLLGLIPGEEFTDGLVAAMAAIPIEKARRELDRLAAAHLVLELAPHRYTFHDLLREYAAERCRADDDKESNETALRRLDDWYLWGVDAAVNRLYPGVTRLPTELPAPPKVTFDSDEQALRWLDGERVNILACVHRAANSGNPRVAWLLADALRGYFWSGMRSVDWLHAAQDGMRAAVAAGDHRAQAAMQLSLGNLHLRIRRFADAVRHSARAVELGEQARWLPGQAAAHQNLGNLRRRSGELKTAIDHYQRALRVNTTLGSVGALAVNLASLGQAHHELGELATAVDYYTKSMSAHRAAGTRNLRATAASLHGKALHELGQLDRAVDLLSEAVELNRSAGNRAFESEACGALARVHLDAGRPELAVELADTALALARDCDDPTIRAAALGAVADTRMHGGDLANAVTCYQQAMQAAHGHSARLELEILNGLAEAKRRLGQFAEATRLSARASRVAGDIGYVVIEAQALATLAAIDLDLHRRDQAAAGARRALELYRTAGHPKGQAHCQKLLVAASRAVP
jgi:DNA-binding SARP family transcriptional activator/DNA-binding XRE family transcriptional regulator